MPDVAPYVKPGEALAGTVGRSLSVAADIDAPFARMAAWTEKHAKGREIPLDEFDTPMKIHLPDLSALLPVLLAGIPTVIAVVAGAVVLNVLLSRGLTLLAQHASFTEGEIGPVRRATKWLITLGAVIFALGAFGINVSGVWGVLSTIVAIGFVAVWSVLSNTLCTLMSMVFRPFSIGDELEFAVEPVKGRVTDLNFIYTTLDCGDGSVLQVPNDLFFQKAMRRRHATGGAMSPSRHLREKPPPRWRHRWPRPRPRAAERGPSVPWERACSRFQDSREQARSHQEAGPVMPLVGGRLLPACNQARGGVGGTSGRAFTAPN